MPGFVVGGGKIDAEGFLKYLLMMFRTGYATGLNVTQRGSGANMSVDVNINASGYAGGLLNTSANVPYIGWIVAIDNVSVNPSDPTNPRIDTVVAYVDLSVISTSITDNTGAFKFKAIAGTPAGSPSAPSGATIQASIGAGNPYTPLGNLAIAANAASVVNANITDIRSPMALQVPYLYGGSSNTKGHLVPNAADDTVQLLTAAQTVQNKTIDNTNTVKSDALSNPYKFGAYRSAAYSTGTANNTIKMPYDAVLYDTGSNFDTTNNRFVAPAAGFYNFNAGFLLQSNTGAVTWMLFKNGSEVKRLEGITASGAFLVGGHGGVDLQLSASDYVECFYSISNTGLAVALGAIFTYFTGHLISKT